MYYYTEIVARLINAFNVTAVSIMVCVAVVGLLFIILKLFKFNVLGRLKRANIFVKGFCVAALAAFALEATAFNFPYYLRYFAGPPIALSEVGIDQNTGRGGTHDGVQVELLENEIRFNNINRRVTSIYFDMNFDNVETVQSHIGWTDEATTREYTKKFYKYLPYENYALLQSGGKVFELTIIFEGNVRISIEDIVINKPIPFYFSGLRLLAVSLLFFALFAFVHKNLRAKAAYYLFECKFDPENKKQNIVYACTVALLILFSGVCTYSSVSYGTENNTKESAYKKLLVDALIAGRTYLDYGNPEKLLNAEHPCDLFWLLKSEFRNGLNVDWVDDWVWYNGKHYYYYGVVPAILVYVPYKMITGDYLSNWAGVFLFCAIAVILLALLWRYCVTKYMPDTRYVLYLLSFGVCFFASGLNYALRTPVYYAIVQSSGFMFTVAGILLLLKSIDREKINYLKLFFACLCLALVFGCRPNMGIASLMVPIVLWRYRTWKLPLFVMLPYILVAIPLCIYNYVRFGSIFEFGMHYQIGAFSVIGHGLQNPIGKFIRMFVDSVCCLFYPGVLSLRFPFVEGREWPGITLGVVHFNQTGFAIINFPIVFCLFYIFKNIFNKNKLKTFYLLYSSLIIAIAITCFNSLMLGYAGRYILDMASFIIIPSLFCAYYWNSDETSVLPPQYRLKITYILCVASILTGLFLFVKGVPWAHFNLTLYRYLEYSLGIIRDI
jgi:hypothetical protein